MKHYIMTTVVILLITALVIMPVQSVSAETATVEVDCDVVTASIAFAAADQVGYPSSTHLDKTEFAYISGSEKERQFREAVSSQNPDAVLPHSDPEGSPNLTVYSFSPDDTSPLYGVTAIDLGNMHVECLVPKDIFVYKLYGIQRTTVSSVSGGITIQDEQGNRTELANGTSVVIDTADLIPSGYGPQIIVFGNFDENAVNSGTKSVMHETFKHVSFTISDAYIVSQAGTGTYMLGLILVAVSAIGVIVTFVLSRRPGWAK